MITKFHFLGPKLFRQSGSICIRIASQKLMSTKQRYDLKGRVALITGAATGIGSEIANALLAEGVKGVTLTDCNEELGKETYCNLAKCYGPQRVQFIKCDVLCHNEIECAFEHTVKCFDQLDIVCTNAGILQETEVYKTININLTGVIVCTQLAIEKYFPKYRSCREGIVLITASILGHTTVPFTPTYCASKHGLIGLAKCYGAECEYKRNQARVMCLCPGFTDTPLLAAPPVRPQHKQAMEEILAKIPLQNVELVGKTAIHMIKCGKPGSSWIISNKKMEEAKIVEAYNIQSCFGDKKC